jgi:hypothetical protein
MDTQTAKLLWMVERILPIDGIVAQTRTTGGAQELQYQCRVMYLMNGLMHHVI